MDVNTAISRLIQALAATKEYQALRNSKEAVKKDTRSDQMLTQFEKKREMLHSQQLSQNQAQMLMNELEQDYEQLSAVPVIREYFTASEAFGKLMDSVMQALNSRLALN